MEMLLTKKNVNHVNPLSAALGSCRVTIITPPTAAVKQYVFYSWARGLQIVVTRLEPSDCRRFLKPSLPIAVGMEKVW